MRPVRCLAAVFALALLSACTTPFPIPEPALVSPYHGELAPRTCEGLGCAVNLGATMNSCTIFGGPISVTLTGYNDPWGLEIPLAAYAIETQGLYGESLGPIGNGEFEYVGQTLSTPDIAPGTCFLVGVKAAGAGCVEPGPLNCISGMPGGSFTVEW